MTMLNVKHSLYVYFTLLLFFTTNYGPLTNTTLIVSWIFKSLCIYLFSLVTRFAITISITQYRQANWIVGSQASMCDRPEGVSGCQLMLTRCYLLSRHLCRCGYRYHNSTALHSLNTKHFEACKLSFSLGNFKIWDYGPNGSFISTINVFLFFVLIIL